eukprot:4224086-Alexandrium_andersonii.AAC.1
MSASLVGSEMCIRDRASASRRRSQRTEPNSLQSWEVSNDTSSTTPSAVSYTHLTLPTICSV